MTRLLEQIRSFRGVDLTDQPAGVDPTRACSCINMIRDEPGKVRKRMGYEQIADYGARINGIYEWNNQRIVHAGTGLYLGETRICSSLADTRSFARALAGKLWLFDGSALWGIGEFTPGSVTAEKAVDHAYLPTVAIGCSPAGGGTQFEPINLLNPKRSESFLCTANATVFQLTFRSLAEIPVTAVKRTADGSVTLSEGVDFTVDRATGTLYFTAAPGIPPVEGEDNLTVTYAVGEGEADRIGHCRFCVCYGIAGASDRIFAAGNPDTPGRDYHCEISDPTYWPDTGYGVIGQADSPIAGYSILGDALATHKTGDDDARNVVLREGRLDEDGDPAFVITGVIQGEGAICPHSFAFLREPLFLTRRGVCATTPYDYHNERYVQNRSFYVDAALCAEPELENACACVWGDFYLLAVGGRVYLLDTLVRDTASAVHSEFRCECFVWENIPARVLCTENERLLFGTEEGKLMRFFSDPDDPASYMDAGKPIAARWDFGFAGRSFFRSKTLDRLFLRIGPTPESSVELWVNAHGSWKKIGAVDAGARVFQYSGLCYSKFSYSGDTEPRALRFRPRIRKADTVRFSLRNEKPGEAFGILEIAIRYIEGRDYRR